MTLDIAALVAPVSDDEPSGPDLYGDPLRLQIEQAFARSISDGAASRNSESQWQDVIDLILEQCQATRDLWLPVYLMRAAANVGNFDLLVEAAGFLASLIEERWADVHPQLEDLGFAGRTAPCESLTRIGEFLGPVERMPLVSHARLGSFSTHDIERIRAKGAKADGFGALRMAIDAIGVSGIEAVLAKVEELKAAIRRVDAVLSDNADGEAATNFAATYDLLAKMRGAVTPFVQQKVVPGNGGAKARQPGDQAMTVEASSGPDSVSISEINDRDGVVRAIDAICAYYARAEPGSPIPFVLRRARDWISLDFIAVLEDIAPGSVGEAMLVLKGRGGDSSGASDWGSDETSEAEDRERSPSEDGDGGWN